MVNVESFVEFVLSNADKIKNEVLVVRLDSGKGRSGGNGTGHTFVSDPTAISAIKNICEVKVVYVPCGAYLCGEREVMKVKKPELWLEVEKCVRSYYLNNASMSSFYRLRFLENCSWKIICKKLDISKSCFYAMRDDVIRFAILAAAGRRLISPYSRFNRYGKN